MNIAFLYEHPDWSESLIQAFSKRNLQLLLLNAADLAFDTSRMPGDYDGVINRVNIMPSADRNPKIVFHTLHYLNWLEIAGVRVINGFKAHNIGSSKVMQNAVFSKLGLNHPAGIAIYNDSDVLQAAKDIGYPVIVKPNIGGSGSGIAQFENAAEVELALKNKMLDLGIDGSGIVQQYIHSDGYVYRVEILGDQLFYSIRQTIQEGVFNYCAADGCSTDSVAERASEEFDFCVVESGSGIEVFDAPEQVLSDIVRIIQCCGADVGGVEYFIESGTNKPCYYDYNPYSNFVTDGESLLGFSPEEQYVEFVISKLGLS